MKDHYIKAVIQLLKDGVEPKAVFRDLVRVLEARHHQKLLPAILAGVAKVYASARGSDQPKVKVANATVPKKDVATALKLLNVEKDPIIIEDDTLIGGLTATYQDKMVDTSYKTALTRLYRSIKH